MVLFRTAQNTLFRAMKTIKNNCQCSQWPFDKSRNVEESFVSLMTIDWQRNICIQYSINISTPLLVSPIALEKQCLRQNCWGNLYLYLFYIYKWYVHILRNSYICKKTKAKDVFLTITVSKLNIKLWKYRKLSSSRKFMVHDKLMSRYGRTKQILVVKDSSSRWILSTKSTGNMLISKR